MGKIKAGGIIQNTNLAQIGIMSVPDRPGIAGAVLGALGEQGINVEFIVQCIDLRNRSHMILCVAQDSVAAALASIEHVTAAMQAEQVISRPNVAVVSVFGPHFRDRPAVAGIAFSALAAVGINILSISTSTSTLSCIIDGEHIVRAVEALKGVFDVPPNAVFSTAAWGLSPCLGAGKSGVAP